MVAEDGMVRCQQRFSGHEFEQMLGDSEGQGSLACCSLWGCKELDMTEELKDNNQQNDYDLLKAQIMLHIFLAIKYF